MFVSENKVKVAVLGIAAAVFCSGCSAMGQAAVPAAAQATPATPVEVRTLDRTSIRNELTYIGQVQPQKTVNVISKLSAEVKEVYFDIGDTVQEGDVLFRVDAKDIADQIKTLQASIAAQEVGVESAKYGLERAQADTAQERLSELQQEANLSSAYYGAKSASKGKENAGDALDYLEDSLDSTSDAYAATRNAYNAFVEQYGTPNQPIAPERPLRDDFATDAEFFDAKDAYDAAKSEYDRDQQIYQEYEDLRDKLSALGSAVDALDGEIESVKSSRDSARIGSDQADAAWGIASEIYDVSKEVTKENKEQAARQAEFGVLSAEAQKNATEVQLAIAQDNMGNAVIKSPLTGVISTRNIEVGQIISQQTVPYTIIAMDTVNVMVEVSETLINTIHPGDEVLVQIQSLGGGPVAGVVTAVSPAAGATSVYPIRIELENASGLIKPGMFAQVSFVKEQAEHTFVVPKNVVLSDESSQYVFVIEDGAAKKVVVTTGLASAQEIEILSGVSETDQIVILGQEYLHDGMPVNVIAVNGERVTAETPEQPEATQPETEEEASRQ